jgi:hypothetical protein
MTMHLQRYLMAVIVLWTSSYINAGTAPVQEPVDREVIARIRDEGLNRSQALETFTRFTDGPIALLQCITPREFSPLTI